MSYVAFVISGDESPSCFQLSCGKFVVSIQNHLPLYCASSHDFSNTALAIRDRAIVHHIMRRDIRRGAR
jgi:hypothetical protein